VIVQSLAQFAIHTYKYVPTFSKLCWCPRKTLSCLSAGAKGLASQIRTERGDKHCHDNREQQLAEVELVEKCREWTFYVRQQE